MQRPDRGPIGDQEGPLAPSGSDPRSLPSSGAAPATHRDRWPQAPTLGARMLRLDLVRRRAAARRVPQAATMPSYGASAAGVGTFSAQPLAWHPQPSTPRLCPMAFTVLIVGSNNERFIFNQTAWALVEVGAVGGD